MISSVCPKCGTMENSGKRSCCGHGGSWFRICGSAGNAKLRHTWFEGIQACKTLSQSKLVIDQQLHAAQHKHNRSSDDGGMLKFKAVITSTHTSASMPIASSTHMSIDKLMAMNASSQSSDSTATAYDDGLANSKDINTEVTTMSTSTSIPTPTIVAVNTLMITSAYTPMSNTSTHMITAAKSHPSLGRKTLLEITVHINILFIIIVF